MKIMIVTSLLVLALNITGIAYSDDQSYWSLIGPGDADQVTSVSVLNNGSVIIGTDIGGLYFSSDQGNSWSSRNQGLLNYDITTAVLEHKKKNMLFVGTRGGLYKSNDAGINWRSIRGGLPKAERYSLSGSIGAIAVDPFDSQKMMMGFGYRASAEGTATVRKLQWSKAIYVSDDYGENWLPVKAFKVESRVYQITYSSTKDVVYAATDSGLYKSQDGGESWGKILNKLVYNIAVYPEQKRIVATSGREGVYSSDDNGSSWHLSNNGLSLGFPYELFSKEVRYSILKKDPSDYDRLFLLNSTWGMSGGLYISEDKGKSWEKYSKDFPESWLKTSKRMNAVAFDQNNSTNVYMGSSRYI